MGQIFLSVNFSVEKLKEIHLSAMNLLCLISEIMGIAKAYTKTMIGATYKWANTLCEQWQIKSVWNNQTKNKHHLV